MRLGGRPLKHEFKEIEPKWQKKWEQARAFHAENAIPADAFARAVVYAMSQPEDVDVNEILFRPTRQEY